MGTSGFAVAVLERLARSEHAPSLVITRPDRPGGRGRRVRSPPVAAAARDRGLELLQPSDVNDEESRSAIAAAAPDAVCICAYGALLREPLLSEHEMLNVHPSLLPRWRGAAPVERAIDAGDTQTGVSIMRPVAELDAGPVFLARTEAIQPGDDYGTLSLRLARLAGDLLVETLDARPPATPQGDDSALYAAKIEREERRLDPTRPAIELDRRVRALTPHIGAYVELAGGERLGVTRAAPALETAEPAALRGDSERLFLGTPDGVLELLCVKPEGGREMDAADYLRGRPPPVAAQ